MSDVIPPLKLVSSRKYNELNERIESCFRTIAHCDGLEDLYAAAIQGLREISIEYDYATIKAAFAENNETITVNTLHFLCEAGCEGCEADMRAFLQEEVEQRQDQEVFDILISLTYLNSDFAFEQIEAIARGEHEITVGSFAYSFDELRESGNPRAKELYMRYRIDDDDSE